MTVLSVLPARFGVRRDAQPVGISVDNSAHHVDHMRGSSAVHRALRNTRRVQHLSSTPTTDLRASVSGSGEWLSPVSTAAKTTDDTRNLMRQHDQNDHPVDCVDGELAHNPVEQGERSAT